MPIVPVGPNPDPNEVLDIPPGFLTLFVTMAERGELDIARKLLQFMVDNYDVPSDVYDDMLLMFADWEMLHKVSVSSVGSA